MINRTSEKVYEVEIKGVNKQISVENLKPAIFVRDVESVVGKPTNTPVSNDPSESASPIPVVNAPETEFKIKPVLKTYTNKKKVMFKIT